MSNPVIADIHPLKIFLKANQEYYFCTCGLSKQQAFCDGSHKGTKFNPLRFKATDKQSFLCQCKHSSKLPFCDGTHKEFNSSHKHKEGPGITEIQKKERTSKPI